MKICLTLLCLGVLLSQAAASRRRWRWRPPWRSPRRPSCDRSNGSERGLEDILREIKRDVDLVHVIESSTYVGYIWFNIGLQYAMETTIAINPQRPIAEDKSRVALIRFSAPHYTGVHFHLGQYNTLNDVIDHMPVPYIADQEVAIGEALRMARSEFRNHSYEDVSPENNRIVWLYSSGHQNAGEADPIQEATFLKEYSEAKLCVLAIGTSTEAGSELLKEIASDNCFFGFKGPVAFRTALQKAVRNIKLCPNDPNDRQ